MFAGRVPGFQSIGLLLGLVLSFAFFSSSAGGTSFILSTATIMGILSGLHWGLARTLLIYFESLGWVAWMTSMLMSLDAFIRVYANPTFPRFNPVFVFVEWCARFLWGISGLAFLTSWWSLIFRRAWSCCTKRVSRATCTRGRSKQQGRGKGRRRHRRRRHRRSASQPSSGSETDPESS